MSDIIAKIGLADWSARYCELQQEGLSEPFYGGPLQRHVDEGCDYRLDNLRYDPSAESLRLWNFLLTEEERLHLARKQGKKIVGAMKDLGTVPVLAFCYPDTVAFYPDGAWWTPCLMEMSEGLFQIADSMGIDDSFCPVRAMLAAFVNKNHFPIPDLLTCSVGATCDDFSAIAQRVEALGYPILWWEMPHRHRALKDQPDVNDLNQLGLVEKELFRIRYALDDLNGVSVSDQDLVQGIGVANRVRAVLQELRFLCYTQDPCPLPALEMLVCEMLAIHFCSDRAESLEVLSGLLDLVRDRIRKGQGTQKPGAARVYWVNPVADLRAMNLLEECGARLCGTEFLFCHAIDPIDESLPPMTALAKAALADPMVGRAMDRADRICDDVGKYGAEAVIISRIPGASHCATEGWVIAQRVHQRLGLPVLEIEVPSLADSNLSSLRTRIEAIVEVVKERRVL
jgi:benzoyl-CoA reductase/2-hydroxyglutaryl-CoA dehydratase subunit BcrC/BadD/HgdB